MSIGIGQGNNKGRFAKYKPTKAFAIWMKHYAFYLENLYDIFCNECNKNSVTWNKKINFETFCYFVYQNSSKYLCPWI